MFDIFCNILKNTKLLSIFVFTSWGNLCSLGFKFLIKLLNWWWYLLEISNWWEIVWYVVSTEYRLRNKHEVTLIPHKCLIDGHKKLEQNIGIEKTNSHKYIFKKIDYLFKRFSNCSIEFHSWYNSLEPRYPNGIILH